ncbi:pseudouridine synthase [Paeniglutamicibacter sp. ANT13_2]|uniref:RNA pseudouridylate synthase n=2 Tax=Paeniglutamicibacter terrestris TaxID=2723403 RepID=A0ABX1GBC8_9MICC|nr:pseudouridine synthase [Paeniglutamicibacter terrestris]
MAMISPLPVRNGVNATRLRVPSHGAWDTICAYMLHRFGHVDAQGITRRFKNGEVVGLHGVVLDEHTPLGEHEFIWYYRNLPAEEPIPFVESILHHDENLLVIDKPHFLPTTPGGRFIQESALVRLRNRVDNPELIPMHRLDRATAGILLFSTNPETRGAYQTLFERREISKTYEAVSALVPVAGRPAGEVLGVGGLGGSAEERSGNAVDHQAGPGNHLLTAAALADRLEALAREPLVYTNRMSKIKGQLRSLVEEGEPNAESRIELLGTGVSAGHFAGLRVAKFKLSPHSGKTHQLRVHLAALGLGILNDPFYPTLMDFAADDYARPLQLLARSISFIDPISGEPVSYTSALELAESPA